MRTCLFLHRPVFAVFTAALALHTAPGRLQAGDCTITPSPFWKNIVNFSNDPFRADSLVFGEPGWIKFTILTCSPVTVYYQHSTQYAFHYEFATQLLDPFIGMTTQEFDSVTLFNAGREALLGAVVLPPPFTEPPISEYGIQFVGNDPIDIQEVISYFNTVRASVTAGPQVQVFYFPTFEQLETALANADLLAANGIAVSSPERWSEGNACYAKGWALGRLKFFAAEDIEDAFLAGDLEPADILLTDAVPSSIPLVAGVITLSPSTPNSHIAILASTFNVPFVHFAVRADAQQAQALVGRRVVLRATEDFASPGFPTGFCNPDMLDVEDKLTDEQVEEILALKAPPPLDITPRALYGAYSANADGLFQDDIGFFGGKASNFGMLRRSISTVCPKGLGLAFDLWSEYLDQPLPGGMTLSEHIEAELAPYTFPPVDMQALADDLDAIEDLFNDTAVTSFTPAQQAAILALLQDPQYNFDPAKNIRFRSSTNVEDSAQFTGAGLYDSFSGCLLDDLDGDNSGPSLCDPTETQERGVFRAIRRVFGSFYNTGAFLERLRYGIDEQDVGMAILVHHSFPDEIELANGVATYERGQFSTTITLVSQIGANAVTNPEPGQIPEQVDVFSFGGQFFPSPVTSSNLVPLGDFVMEWPDDYEALAALLDTAADRFALETGKATFLLDFEYKKLAPGGAAIPAGGLEVDQIREVPQPDTTPSITPFLVNVPTDYIVLQGGGGNVFANHRLKAAWLQETHNLWLDPLDLAGQTIYAQTDVSYNDSCTVSTLAGDIQSFPQYAHNYSPNTQMDSWRIETPPQERHMALTTLEVGALVSPAQSPILTVADLGPFESGQLQLQATYDAPVQWYEYDFQTEMLVPVSGTQEDIQLVPQFEDSSNDQLREATFVGPGGVTIQTSYYLHPVGGICAGCIFPLGRWEQTTITGLTSEPIVLTSDFAQSYDAGQHNFTEWFLFEPRLDPGVTLQQLNELAEQGIDQIVVFKSFSPEIVAYISAGSCTCSTSTGIGVCADLNGDGVRDDNCTWWACAAGACASTDIVFADMGGLFGSCAPDGAADVNDRFHVLNCFANQDTEGTPGYPCEDAPPAALNVDAGGSFGDCAPDGVCDGHDVFHALNAFSGTTTCSCPGPGPSPAPAPGEPARAQIALRPSTQVLAAGARIEVEAQLLTALPDLRGYQLHVGVRGGKQGQLRLVDMFLAEPGVLGASASAPEARRDRRRQEHPPTWQSFNVHTGQLLVGLDSPGFPSSPGYLATLVFEASPDALGTFAVELRADAEDPSQRTFLFPTPADGRIDVEASVPAMIRVAEARRRR